MVIRVALEIDQDINVLVALLVPRMRVSVSLDGASWLLGSPLCYKDDYIITLPQFNQ